MLIIAFLLHHSEPADPTLILWIQEKLTNLLGVNSLIILLTVCLIIIVFPIFIIAKALIRQSQSKKTRP